MAQLIRVGNRIINLDNVIKIDLESTTVSLTRRPLFSSSPCAGRMNLRMGPISQSHTWKFSRVKKPKRFASTSKTNAPICCGRSSPTNERKKSMAKKNKLRDRFAAQALASLATAKLSPQKIAEKAYQLADAMLAARKPKEPAAETA
jgi:hypothetical protein